MYIYLDLNFYNLHRKPLGWLKTKLDRNEFLVVACILVGITVGAAAVAMKTLVHFMNKLVTNDWGDTTINFLLFLIFPLLGILLTVFIVQFFLNKKDGKGLSNILFSIIKKGSNIERAKMYSQLVTAPITVGLGGSSGLEAPIVITGSAIGSNFAKAYNLNYRDKTLLLACGASAGIAGMFNAPIAGLMFAIEVILVGVSIMEFIPLILASVAGTLFCQIVLKQNILFEFENMQSFDYKNTLFYIGLGWLCAAYSIVYIRTQIGIEKLFHQMKISVWGKALIGGIVLSILIYFIPSFFGEGYNTIVSLAKQDVESITKNVFWKDAVQNELYLILFIGVIGLLKGVATSTTIFAGGNGGNFAPSLFVGAHVGYFYSSLINYFGWVKVPINNFTMVAMAGILSGVWFAPITAIFLIAEVAGGYDLIIPLMIVSAISYFTVKKFQPHTLVGMKLKEKGTEITQDKDSNLLNIIELEKIVDKKAYCLHVNDRREDVIKAIQRSHRNIFPVVNRDKKLKGIVIMDQLREVLFNSQDDFTIKDIMRPPDAIIDINDTVVEAMKKFDDTKTWSLPVLDQEIYIGMMSKSSLLSAYRNELVKQSN